MQNRTEYLLSICIPTFNRDKLLPIALDSILAQFKKNPELENLIEIVVSDNASTDTTESVVLEYQKKFTQVKYFRNSENIGGDLNLANSVVKATGKYAWYLGDDDALVLGSLSYIVGILNEFKPAVIGVNSEDLVDPNKLPTKMFAKEKAHPVVLQSYSEFMAKRYCLGILSVILFDRELWMQIDRSKFHKLWLYYEIILKLMPKAQGRNFVYINEPCVYTGVGCGWATEGGELRSFLDWKEILTSLNDYGYDKHWVAQELSNFPKWLIIILLRAKGHDLSMNFRHLKRVYSAFSGKYLTLALATLIFYIPNFIIKILRDTKKIVRVGILSS